MTKTASVYGAALYELASEEGLGAEIYRDMGEASELISENPDFVKLISLPELSGRKKEEIIEACFGSTSARYLLNFMKLLAREGKFREFSGCYAEYRERYIRDHNIEEVRVTTAVPIKEEQAARLKAKLGKLTGKEIEMVFRVDKSLLGGIKLEAGGIQTDGTVRRQLETIESTMRNTVM